MQPISYFLYLVNYDTFLADTTRPIIAVATRSVENFNISVADFP